MFGVVVCGACRRVQVIEFRVDRFSCRACGKASAWRDRKVFYHGSDADEARRVAARVSLEVGGAGIEAIAESAAAAEAERRLGMDDVVRSLAVKPEFDVEDIASTLAGLRLSWSPDRVVAFLLAADSVFEPRPGRFRWIG